MKGFQWKTTTEPTMSYLPCIAKAPSTVKTIYGGDTSHFIPDFRHNGGWWQRTVIFMKIVVAVLLLVELLTMIFSLFVGTMVHGKYFKEMEAWWKFINNATGSGDLKMILCLHTLVQKLQVWENWSAEVIVASSVKSGRRGLKACQRPTQSTSGGQFSSKDQQGIIYLTSVRPTVGLI